jgi:hypothetical protein
MATTDVLTGRWSGHYQQFGTPHPISAHLVQQGVRLSGSMRDGETNSERSVFEAAMEAGLPPGADEEIIARLREQYPDVPASAPVRAVTSLPAESVLEGMVQGRQVYFLKTYQGEHFSGLRVGNRRVGRTVDRHEVHYQGKVNADGTVIEGNWWIEPTQRGERRAEGSFQLKRVSEGITAPRPRE